MFISYFILLAFGFLTEKEYITFINFPKESEICLKTEYKSQRLYSWQAEC